VISYREGVKKVNGVEKPSEESVGYETINLEKSKEDDKPIENSAGTKEEIPNSNDSKAPINESNDKVDQTEKTVETSVQPDITNESKTDSQVSVSNSEKEQESETSVASTSSAANKGISHTVQPNENLYRIAMKYYNSPKGMDIIMKANHLTSKQINAGQVLKIPMNN
jgi:LysM repeat protein